ncbi:hypothetical protein N9139_01070 [Akkermansiaceae bacterium]|nr:hypothetical protein [Akkermansiaceae bacterium]
MLVPRSAENSKETQQVSVAISVFTQIAALENALNLLPVAP